MRHKAKNVFAFVGSFLALLLVVGVLNLIPPSSHALAQTPANSQPGFSETTTTRQVSESQIEGETIGEPVSATDADGDSLSYSLGGTDANSFSLNEESGQLKVKASLDYETKSAHTVTVSVHDGKNDEGQPDTSIDATITVDIAVLNFDEAPIIMRDGGRVETDQITYIEHESVPVATYTAFEPEGDPVTWSIPPGVDSDLFKISSSGVLSFKEPPDYENPRDGECATDDDPACKRNSDGSYVSGEYHNNAYYVSVMASSPVIPDDGYEPNPRHDVLAVRVIVSQENRGPTLEGYSTVSKAENGYPLVHPFHGEDPEFDTLAWALLGADARHFSIDQWGVLSFKDETVPDFEDPQDANRDNAYQVTIRVSDGDLDKAATKDVTVTVTDVNEKPYFTQVAPLAISVGENAPEGTNIGSPVKATDPEGHTPLFYVLKNGPEGYFTIDSDTGQIRAGASLTDFETGFTYDLKVGAGDEYDHGSGDYIQDPVDSKTYELDAYIDVLITVNDVNEPPEFDEGDSTTREIAENTPSGQNIGEPVTASDPDPNDEPTYSLAGPDQSAFGIDSNTGQLMTKVALNKEIRDTYSVVVQVTDGRNPQGRSSSAIDDSIDVTINVGDQDEALTVRGATRVSYAENKVSQVAKYTAIDPEQETITWSLEGMDSGLLAISETGELTFVSPPDFESPQDSGSDNTYDISVKASDGTHDDTVQVTVSVINVNEAPTVSGDKAFEFAENGVGAVGTFTAVDPEDQTVRWSLSGADRGDLTIDSGGELNFRRPPDFEEPADNSRDNVYEITVQGSDGALNDILNVEVTVTNANDLGSVILSPSRPRVDSPVTATLKDQDGQVTSIYWQWAIAEMSNGPYTDINGAATGTYTPLGSDLNKYLRATASYTDSLAPGQEASATSSPVINQPSPPRTADDGNDGDGSNGGGEEPSGTTPAPNPRTPTTVPARCLSSSPRQLIA